MRRIWLYGLDNWGEDAADAYLAKLYDHFDDLADSPLAYPATELREGYRRSLCGVDRIYYRITDGTVEVMAILGRQDATAWL